MLSPSRTPLLERDPLLIWQVIAVLSIVANILFINWLLFY
jgi:hypothetical protein